MDRPDRHDGRQTRIHLASGDGLEREYDARGDRARVDDLLLYDYNERVRKQQEAIRKRKAELMEKLKKIQEQAKEMEN